MHIKVTEAGSVAHENVTVTAFQADEIRELMPEFDRLTDAEKVYSVRRASGLGELAIDQMSTGNSVVRGLDTSIPKSLNPNDPPIVIQALSIGSGDQEPSYDNTELNNEESQIEVATVESVERDLLVSTYLGQDRANGIPISEIGLLAGRSLENMTLVNHAVIDLFEKTTMRELLVDVELRFRAFDSGEVAI